MRSLSTSDGDLRSVMIACTAARDRHNHVVVIVAVSLAREHLLNLSRRPVEPRVQRAFGHGFAAADFAVPKNSRTGSSKHVDKMAALARVVRSRLSGIRRRSFESSGGLWR